MTLPVSQSSSTTTTSIASLAIPVTKQPDSLLHRIDALVSKEQKNKETVIVPSNVTSVATVDSDDDDEADDDDKAWTIPMTMLKSR